MKSNSSEVRSIIQAHIESHIDYKDYENCESLKEALRSQIDYMRIKDDSDYKTASRLVEGGRFLCYTSEVEDFLNTLHLNNNSNKKFNEYEIFKMYTHLIANEVVRIIK